MSVDVNVNENKKNNINKFMLIKKRHHIEEAYIDILMSSCVCHLLHSYRMVLKCYRLFSAV